MVATNHLTYTYVGMAGEGDFIGEGGIFRQADGEDGWDDISAGLPGEPQVRALLLEGGQSRGSVRRDAGRRLPQHDRGDSWERVADPAEGREVWSLAAHPSDPDTIFAGYEPCAIARSQDGGETWQEMDTSKVIYPHITTYMPPAGQAGHRHLRRPGPTPATCTAAIEVGGLIGQPRRRRDLDAVDGRPVSPQQHP